MWKHLILLLCCCALGINAAAKSCTITLNDDLKSYSPIILKKSSGVYKIFRPAGKATKIDDGSTLSLNCPGIRNVIGSTSKTSMTLSCKQGRFLNSKGKKVNLSTILCKTMPRSVLTKTTTSCSNGQGVIHKVGVEVQSKFFRIYDICYDKPSARTYYAHNTLNGGAIKYRIKGTSRPSFDVSDTKFKATAANSYYNKTYQFELFEKLFGTGQKYMDTGKNFLARGHLTPDADFIFGYEQYSTYYYMNTAPQYQSVNAVNWLKVEMMSRILASKYGRDMESYNGYWGEVKFPRTSGAMVKVYLDPDQNLYIPKYYFKVLWAKASDSAIVFVSVNNPITASGKADEFCTNICKTVKLYHSNFSDVKKGYTFCCELEDFKKTVNVLPKEVKATKLLTG